MSNKLVANALAGVFDVPNVVSCNEQEYPIEAIKPPQEVKTDKEGVEPLEDIEKAAVADFDFVRGNLKLAIGKCAEVMPAMVEMAETSESAMMLNAMTNFFKIYSDMNKTLLDSANSALKARNGGTVAKKAASVESTASKEPAPTLTTEEFLKLAIAARKQSNGMSDVVDAE